MLGFKVFKHRLILLLGGNAAGDCNIKSLLTYHNQPIVKEIKKYPNQNGVSGFKTQYPDPGRFSRISKAVNNTFT
jgi:hypothetical protein